MKTYTLIIISLIALSGCVTQEKCSKQFPCLKETDTTRTKIVEVVRHDTIFEFQPDSSSIQALIECEGNIPRLKQIIAYNQGKRIEIPIIKFKDKVLYVECRVDSAKVAKTWFEKRTTEYTKIKQNSVQVEFRQKSWQAALMWAGIVALVIILVYIIIRFAIPLLKKASI